jgi:hypothetical protein
MPDHKKSPEALRRANRRRARLYLAKPKRSAVPRGPRGEKRPADVIGAAVMVGKIATGEH